MKARYWSLGAVLGGLAVAGTAWAALDCGPVPSCEELGFTNTADQCDDSGMLKCPFDETAVFCRKKAPVTGVGCEIGSVLYSDLNCYDPDAAPSGLTAIGVVFDTENRLAVEVDIGGYVKWGDASGDISALKNCTSISVASSTCEIDGKANTVKIVAYYGQGTDYAAGYCYNYTTEGTQKGDWFLPSAKELMTLESVRSTVNSSLSSVGGESLNNGLYWSSTERKASSAWDWLAFLDGSLGSKDKAYSNYARCVVGY